MRKILLIMIGFSVLFGADTFTDAKTGLTWQDNIASATVEKNWNDAKEYCRNLNLDGYSDWRLPSIKELQSIVDITKYNPAIKSGFKNVTSNFYWSSSPFVSDSFGAWIVDFSSGNTDSYNKSGKTYVRCVRGRQKH